jgi:hypothetical protein
MDLETTSDNEVKKMQKIFVITTSDANFGHPDV